MTGLRIAACAVAAATYLFTALWLLPVGVETWTPLALVPFVAIAVLMPPTVGGLIAFRQPRNLVAWILLLGAFLLMLQVPVGLVLGEAWTLQLDRALWPLLYAWPIAIAFVFPDGHLLSRRWAWVAGAGAACFVAFMTLGVLDPGPFYGDDASVPNPMADNAVAAWIWGHGLEWVWIPLWLGMLATLFAGVVAVWLRLRRSTGIERLQTMWLAWSAALIPVALLLCGASSFALGDSLLDYVVFPLLLLAATAVSASVGIAVTRYRLYAIDRLINRTAVYATLTVVLALLYAGVSVGLGVVLGRGAEWVTAAATLAVAIVFLPLRSHVQRFVDRRFSRARFDAVQLVRAFEEDVRENRRAPEEIGPVVATALRDPSAEILYWLAASESFADASGALTDGLPDDGRARSEINRGGARTAVLLHDPALLLRRQLLDDVLSVAALSIEIARLRVEVRISLAEVAASRARIIEAGYEERRRLERDLHDGAQQRLVSLGMRLRRMQRGLPQEARVLAPAFDQVVDEIGSAIADLRQIAAGVRPARLDDGLAAALQDLARDVPIPVDVDATVPRVAASVEAAAYFVACEALTNAVKHAAASSVAVRAVRESGSVLVSVADDGVGGAVARRGSGLSGLRDRVAAHGGTLEIVSPPGGGTRIEVALPCDS